MSEFKASNASPLISGNECSWSALSCLDSKVLLVLSGMICLTTIICVGFVSFSGSEMTLSKNGLSITQPNNA